MTEDMLRDQETALAALSSFDQVSFSPPLMHGRMLEEEAR